MSIFLRKFKRNANTKVYLTRNLREERQVSHAGHQRAEELFHFTYHSRGPFPREAWRIGKQEGMRSETENTPSFSLPSIIKEQQNYNIYKQNSQYLLERDVFGLGSFKNARKDSKVNP